MSVINQMLRDLDLRDASEQERAGLPPRLRSLPPIAMRRAQSIRMLLLGMGIGMLVAGGAVGFFMSSNQPAPALAPADSAKPLPIPAAAPVEPPAPAVPPPAHADTGEMRLSTQLTPPDPTSVSASRQEPAPREPAAPSPKPLAAKPAAPLAESSEAKAASPHPTVAVTPQPGAETRIDKRAKGGEAHEKAEAEYRKGMQAVKRGDAAAAAPLFQHALELEPKHARARQALLATLVGGKQWAEARQIAESGLVLDPTQAGWAVILARLQLEQGDAAAAVATLDRHAVHATGDADYQGLFAYLLQKQQRPAEAAERFRAGLALRPGEARWWFGLGLALEYSGNAAGAREAYGKARDIGNLPADMTAAIEQKLK